MKTCGRCRVEKPYADFNKNKARGDGLQGNCRPCQKSIDKTQYYTRPERRQAVKDNRDKAHKQARAHVDKFLKWHHCVDCGEADPIVLDFDHVRGEKVVEISYMIKAGFSLKTLQLEIDKCEVRCANCHRRVTYKRRIEARNFPVV